jgi:hypothetical protein
MVDLYDKRERRSRNVLVHKASLVARFNSIRGSLYRPDRKRTQNARAEAYLQIGELPGRNLPLSSLASVSSLVTRASFWFTDHPTCLPLDNSSCASTSPPSLRQDSRRGVLAMILAEGSSVISLPSPIALSADPMPGPRAVLTANPIMAHNGGINNITRAFRRSVR